MKSIFNHIREHFYSQFINNGRKNIPYLDSLRKTEWSNEFEKLMRNRLITGAIRYGMFKDTSKNLNRVKAIEDKLKLYKKDRNKEHLVDIGNYSMLEFEEGDGYFKPIDDGLHCEKNK